MDLSKSPSALFLALRCSYKHTHWWYFNSDMMDFVVYNKASMIQRWGEGGCCLFVAAGKTNKQTNKQLFLNLAVFNTLKHA